MNDTADTAEKPPTKRDLAKAQTRERVLKTFKVMFDTIGYDKTDIRTAAKVMGMSTGAVFSNFESKAAIYEAIYGHPPISPEAGREALALLSECAAQFRFYETQHRAKGTPEANEKARVNAEIAGRIEVQLAASGYSSFTIAEESEA